MWSWVTCHGDDPTSVFWIEITSTSCTPASVCRSIHEFLSPNLTSAPVCVSFPTPRGGLVTSLCTKGVWAYSITRPPGPKTSHDTITFLPEGTERQFAFHICTFEGPKSRPPSAKFHGQVCSSQALSSGRNSASAGLSFPYTLRTHDSFPSSLLFSSSEQSPLIPVSSITSVSSTAAPVAVDGASPTAWTFLSYTSAQTLPTVCTLVTFLATVATLSFKLGWSVLVRLGVLRFALALGLALGLIKLAVFHCVAGTSAHEASLSLALPECVDIHRRCTCTV